MYDQSDFFVEGRSNDQLRQIAEGHRALLDPRQTGEVNIFAALEFGIVSTVRGQKRVTIIQVSDEKMGRNDAICISDENGATLTIKTSVYLSAKQTSNTAAHRRANFTLGHEYSHIVLCHTRAPMARATGVNASTHRPSFIPAYRSAEHQANYLAGAILIDPKAAAEYKTAAEIGLRFNVSQSAAEVFVEDRSRRQKSPVVAAGLHELSRSLAQHVRRGKSDVCPTGDAKHDGVFLKAPTNESLKDRANANVKPAFGPELDLFKYSDGNLWMPCSCGGQRKPSGGNKFVCTRCGNLSDPPDGDSYGT